MMSRFANGYGKINKSFNTSKAMIATKTVDLDFSLHPGLHIAM
jgi:hypothetical protein